MDNGLIFPYRFCYANTETNNAKRLNLGAISAEDVTLLAVGKQRSDAGR